MTGTTPGGVGEGRDRMVDAALPVLSAGQVLCDATAPAPADAAVTTRSARSSGAAAGQAGQHAGKQRHHQADPGPPGP